VVELVHVEAPAFGLLRESLARRVWPAGPAGHTRGDPFYILSDSDPKHARSQVSPTRGESRFPAGRRGARALTRAEHIGMEGVLRLLQLRQMRQKKAEVHTGSPGVTEDALRRKASRPGRALSSARGGSRLPAFLRAIQKEAA